MKTTFATVLQNKEFVKLWMAQVLSLVCAYMLNFILIGKIYQLTASAIAVGLFWGFFIFPSITLGPLTGVFLDYLDKKKVLILSSFSQAFVVLLYLAAGQQIWTFYTIVLLYSFLDEFLNPAISVLIPSIVKKSELAAANSFFLFTTQGSLFLGFLLGGLLLKFFGFSRLPFILASLLLLLASFLASRLKWQETAPKKKIKASLASFWAELLKGYNFIRSEPKVLFPMVLLGGLQIILGTLIIFLPSIAKDLLAIDFADSSLVVIMPAVLGAITGSFLTEKLMKRYLKRVLVTRGLFFLGLLALLTGFSLPLFRLPVIVGSFLAFFVGIAFVVMLIPLRVLIQENTPFSVRGRVFGTLNTLITVAAAIPVLMMMTLVDFLGIGLALVLLGLSLLLLTFYVIKGQYAILSNYHRS